MPPGSPLLKGLLLRKKIKGIISLLIRVFEGQLPQDILSADLHFIDEIGLRENLSPTRANGLVSMIERIKEIARNAR